MRESAGGGEGAAAQAEVAQEIFFIQAIKETIIPPAKPVEAAASK